MIHIVYTSYRERATLFRAKTFRIRTPTNTKDKLLKERWKSESMKSKSRHVYKTGNITGPAIYVLNNVYFNTMKILFFLNTLS